MEDVYWKEVSFNDSVDGNNEVWLTKEQSAVGNCSFRENVI